MSVNVGQRNVPETPANNQCYAVDAVLDVCLHTLRICSNEKIFITQFKNIVAMIENLVVDMYLCAYLANKIRVIDAQTWQNRNDLQVHVLQEITEMLGLINVARRLFHLHGKKAVHWIELTDRAKSLVQKWHDSDKERYNKTMKTENKLFTVYKHTSPSNKVYIGITSKKNPQERWLTSGRGYYRQKEFYNAIKKYGWDNFKHEIIAINLPKQDAEEMEIQLIEKYKSRDTRFGYNIAIGGLVNTGFTLSENAREKISKAHIGKTHVWSEDAIRKIKKSKKGFVFTDEHKRKLSQAHIGKTSPNKDKHFTEKQKQKMSLSHKGKSPVNKGIPLTEEQKQKISLSRKGKYTGADNKKSIPVSVYKDGKLIGNFVSIKEAKDCLGLKNSSCICRAMQTNTRAYGYNFISLRSKEL